MQISAPARQHSHAVIEAHPDPVPAFYLSRHAYVREFEDGAIILDLRNDTYVGVDVQHLAGLRTCIGNWPDSGIIMRKVQLQDTSTPETLIAELLTRGILTKSLTSKQPPPAASPTTALTATTSGLVRRRISLIHVAQFAIAYLLVALRLKRHGLVSLTDWLRRQQSSIDRRHSVAQPKTVARLTSFFWLRTWCYTARRRCLFDSLVLSVYLTRGMVPCTFVVGVSTKPFLAHAWVQIAGSVLNDTVERVQDFAPILSIGDD
jgi:hypothetical protein